MAEGVETALQCEWLVAAGCTYAQGYFLSPPLEVPAATALLLREREESERAAVND